MRLVAQTLKASVTECQCDCSADSQARTESHCTTNFTSASFETGTGPFLLKISIKTAVCFRVWTVCDSLTLPHWLQQQESLISGGAAEAVGGLLLVVFSWLTDIENYTSRS